MEKGKLGIRFGFYGVLAFVLAYLGYTTLLFLLAGLVVLVEKDEWTSRQVLQAFFLGVAGTLLKEFVGVFDFIYKVDIPFIARAWSWFVEGVYAIIYIAILVFAIIGIVKNAKGKEANIPLASHLADWAYGVVRKKAVAPQANPAMGKCTGCGAPLTGGAFCNACGKPVNGPAPSQPQQPQNPQA